jgi:hypothetical protein
MGRSFFPEKLLMAFRTFVCSRIGSAAGRATEHHFSAISPNFLNGVREWLNDFVPYRWIGRHGPNDLVFLRWPPRSPDLTPCDFFLCGYVKDRVYVPQIPTNLPEFRRRIVAAVATITPDTLTRVWEEFDYRVDVCRVTNGAHIEHL